MRVLAALPVALLVFATAASAATLIRGAGGSPKPEAFVQAWGVRMEHARQNFGQDGEIAVNQIAGTAPVNMLYAGEKATVTIQVSNLGKSPLEVKGRWVLVEYRLLTLQKGVFDLGLEKLGETALGPVSISLPGSGFADVVVAADLPARFGGYALLLERDNGTRLFASGLARIRKPELAAGERFYQVCMDLSDPAAVERLHTAPNRIGVGYVPTMDKNYQRAWDRASSELKALQKAGYPVCIEFGAGVSSGEYLPLGRTRPHLDAEDVMLDTKSDYAWLPSYDPDFKEFVKRFAVEFGWPKGPVNAMKLWNEPWNGLSISGWGADDLRYREIYTALCEGVEEARKEAGVQVLLGGCDSSSNTFDKLFPDGDMKFLKWLDFMSLHYQGLRPSNARFMRDRKGENGRTLFWDTESWVANSQDRVPSVLAGMLAAGHDRVVGIQSHAVVATPSNVLVYHKDAKPERREVVHAWPVAPAQTAFQDFVGNRPFRKLLWEGLPWVFVFDGRTGPDGKPDADDLTIIVSGDLGAFFGRDNMALRDCVGLAERAHKEQLRARLAALPDGADARVRAELQAEIDQPEPLTNAWMTLPADPRWTLYDGSGNAVAGQAGLRIPLDASGWYLRPDGSKGSGEALLAAVGSARIEGYEPLSVVVRDMTAPVASRPSIRLELLNVLNRPVAGALKVAVDGLTLQAPATLAFQPHEKKVVDVLVTGGAASERNQYPLRLSFDAGADGIATHEETIRVNLIARRAITVDGDLSDWRDVLPQSVTAAGGGPTLMETAWLPMVKFDAALSKGFATAWMAADDRAFYFAAKIADDTADPGMRRYATLDADYAFYPEVSYEVDRQKTRAPRLAQVRAEQVAKITVVPRVWEPVSATMDLTLDLPGEKMVSLYLIDDDFLYRRTVLIEAADAGGKRLGRAEVKGIEGTWVRLRLSGKVTLSISGRNWLRAAVNAVAVDPLPPADAVGKGILIGEDAETKNAYQGKYGKDLLLLPGEKAAATLPAFWSSEIARIEMRWPAGVRRFSYRMRPDLPQGSSANHDNVQIAFNVLPDDSKPWYPAAPGTFKGYAGYWDTDYEYALNPVAEAFGGGVEVWRLRAPGLPDKHYYPRSPKSPREGAVAGAHLVVRREGNTRIVEASIPWEEIPEVKAARDAGRPIRFSYRVNDNAGGSCMELSRGRSVAHRNGSFKPDWVEHWANELEFGWEK